MKVYLAGSSADSERVRRWRDRLLEDGIEVVSTWLDVLALVGDANPRGAAWSDRERWSKADLAELASADVLWLLVAPSDKPTRGAWLELGFAIGQGIHVVASGDTRQSIFCALADEYERDEDALDRLCFLARGAKAGAGAGR